MWRECKGCGTLFYQESKPGHPYEYCGRKIGCGIQSKDQRELRRARKRKIVGGDTALAWERKTSKSLLRRAKEADEDNDRKAEADALFNAYCAMRNAIAARLEMLKERVG